MCQERRQAVRHRVAPEVGFEPTTKRLTAARSTTELLGKICTPHTFQAAATHTRRYQTVPERAKVIIALKVQGYNTNADRLYPVTVPVWFQLSAYRPPPMTAVGFSSDSTQ